MQRHLHVGFYVSYVKQEQLKNKPHLFLVASKERDKRMRRTFVIVLKVPFPFPNSSRCSKVKVKIFERAEDTKGL